MVDRLGLEVESGPALEAKHFFSGAALYADGKICVLFSPTGLALKVPADLRRRLIEADQGAAFRFFPDGPIKRQYISLPEATLRDNKVLRELLVESVNYVAGRSSHVPAS